MVSEGNSIYSIPGTRSPVHSPEAVPASEFEILSCKLGDVLFGLEAEVDLTVKAYQSAFKGFSPKPEGIGIHGPASTPITEVLNDATNRLREQLSKLKEFREGSVF